MSQAADAPGTVLLNNQKNLLESTMSRHEKMLPNKKKISPTINKLLTGT
jgi:hypothetical protein